jgi:excisionase family DNA binding protein
MDELLTTSELCEWLKITRGTAWKWREQGMPYIGSGKGIRYKQSEVELWLVKRKNNKVK